MSPSETDCEGCVFLVTAGNCKASGASVNAADGERTNFFRKPFDRGGERLYIGNNFFILLEKNGIHDVDHTSGGNRG
jgi:hypothetical protein